MKTVLRITAICAIVIVVLLGVVWLVLGSSMFRDTRATLVSRLLADIAEHPVVIEGDVYLSVLPRLEIVATGLRLPAENFPSVDLARLDIARFRVTPLSWLTGEIQLPEIYASGLTVNLFRSEDDATTWASPPVDEAAAAPQPETQEQPDLVAFLGTRTVRFADMRVRAENRKTGFEFDFELGEFLVSQQWDGDRNTARVASHGLMNGQPVSFGGTFPDGAPFDAGGQLGALEFNLAGARLPDGPVGTFEGVLKIDTPDLQNLLDTLKLQGELTGAGRAETRMVRRHGALDLEDISLESTLGNGAVAKLEGRFGDARAGPDFDLLFLLDLVGEGEAPERAIFLKDIKPKSFEMHVVGADGVIEVERVAVETNAFDEEIRRIGPFRVERVVRTPEGRLRLDGLTISVGPENAPFLSARGDVGSILTLEDYRLTGELDLPATQVLLTLRPEEAEKFGRLTGSLRLEDIGGRATLSDLTLVSRDSDVWNAVLSMDVGDLRRFEDLSFSVDLGTADSGAFFGALQLEAVDAGPFRYRFEIQRSQRHVTAASAIGVGASTIEADLDLRIADNIPLVRGEIRSDSVSLADFRNAIRAAQELARARSVYEASRSAGGTAPDEDFQPLVISEEPEPEDEDLSDFQPLVLEEPAPEEDDLSDFQPLVLSQGAGDLSLEDLGDPKKMARLLDAEIGINIGRIIGQKGISSLESTVVMKQGRLRAGPLRLAYGGGYADLSATMDVVEAPDWLHVSGQTGGWDIGEILNSLGAGIGASGILNGSFNVSGRRASLREFLRSLNGRAMVEMRNGRISTGLIDLAGLGVLPWLFSSERRQGQATIVCLRAPFRIGRGRLETDAAVLETRRVQLVGSGTIDIRNDRISLRAEPRPVGQPLSRSAWPIQVSGALSDPQVSIAKRRVRRTPTPLELSPNRVPCVPDVKQLVPAADASGRTGPR